MFSYHATFFQPQSHLSNLVTTKATHHPLVMLSGFNRFSCSSNKYEHPQQLFRARTPHARHTESW